MTTVPPPRDQWPGAVRAHSTRLRERLQELDRHARALGPAGEPLLLDAVAEARAAIEELNVTEEELRVQGEQLADAEGGLERQRRHYQELFDFCPDALLLTDARGVVLEASHAVSALVGFARAYTLNKPLAAFVHADSVAALAGALERLRGAADGRVQTLSLRLRGIRSGPPRDIVARVAPVHDDGALIGLRWSLRDVTEETARTLALAALRAEHERELRTRTMELEAIARMQAARIADDRRTVERVTEEAARALEHGAEPRVLLAHVLAELAATRRDGPSEG